LDDIAAVLYTHVGGVVVATAAIVESLRTYGGSAMFLNALLVSAILSAAPEVPAEQVRLNSRMTKVLDALDESYYNGNWVALGKQLSSRMVLRMKPKKLS